MPEADHTYHKAYLMLLAALIKAWIFAILCTPSSSMPLLTSTPIIRSPMGPTDFTASATFSGLSPPASRYFKAVVFCKRRFHLRNVEFLTGSTRSQNPVEEQCEMASFAKIRLAGFEALNHRNRDELGPL
jgi:hypothetical protein